MSFFKTRAAKNALLLGVLCTFSYVGIYLVRYMLGAATPLMEEGRVASREYIAVMASLYSIVYAAGNLVNGIIGDRVKARHLVSFGLFFGGLCILLLPLLIPTVGALALYGAAAFLLSSVYNPMIKIVAESTEPPYTERCSIGFTVASFLGSPLAGILAAYFVWQGVFNVSGLILMVMGAVCFAAFLKMERSGLVQYGRYPAQKGGKLVFRALLEHNFIRFTIITILTGIVRTAVVFWVPTYMKEFLGFDSEKTGLVYAAISLILSSSTLLAILLYEAVFKSRPRRTYLAFFIVGTACFFLSAIIRVPVLNVALLTLALLANGCAAGLLYCQYCPTLKDTGMVSSATGFMTGISYVGSSIASSVYGLASRSVGWQPLVFSWTGLMLIGAVVMLPVFDYKKKPQTD